MSANDTALIVAPGREPIHPDAILDGAVPLRGEYDPADGRRRLRDTAIAWQNFPYTFALAIEPLVIAVNNAAKAMGEMFSNPEFKEIIARFGRQFRAARRDMARQQRAAAEARWRGLGPRQRKDIARRRRKGMGR